MDSIVINTGLPGFLLLSEITEAGEKEIAGSCLFSDAPPWLIIESMAQLGAFHVRCLTGFEKHAFLLKINRCPIPMQNRLDGAWLLRGKLAARSSASFLYEMKAWNGEEREITGKFLYATLDHDDVFRKEVLREHYLRAFKCLMNVTGKDSS